MKYRSRNVINGLLILLWLELALSMVSAGAKADTRGGEAARQALELVFSTHLDASLPEQDVFIERRSGSGKVYRVTIADIDPNAPLFKAARPIPRNPFDAIAVGPHPKGEPFGMTLGEWLGHAGSGTYSCMQGEGQLVAEFSGLVRNGVYSIWHAFTARPVTVPFSGYLAVPLGAPDGSTSIFIADEQGRAIIRRVFRPCLQLSGIRTTSLLMINYHSDSKTHAGRPGLSGYNAHVPLFLILPPRLELAADSHISTDY